MPLIEENFQNRKLMIDLVVKNVFWQMDLDRKVKALKQLQGNIWKKAYECGDVKGQ